MYFFALGIFLFYQVYQTTLFNRIFSFDAMKYIVFLLSATFLFVKVLFDSDFKHVVIHSVILMLFLLVGLKAGNIRDLLLVALFIYEARNITFESVLKLYIWIIGFIMVVTIAAFYCGVFNRVDTSTLRSGSLVARSSLGFSWTTYAPNLFMTIALSWMYLIREKKNIIPDTAFLFLVNYFLYVKTNTKAVFIEVLLLLVAGLVISLFKLEITKWKWLNMLYVSGFSLCALTAIGVTLMYSPNRPILEKINRSLNYRLSLGKTAFEEYSIRLFGNKVNYLLLNSDVEEYFYIDSSYVQLLIQYGFLLFALLIILFSLVIYYFIKTNNSIGIICMAVLAIHSITDPQLFNLAYTPFLLLFAPVMMEYSERFAKRKLTVFWQ